MWTNKDVTKIGRLANKDGLKGLIPGLGKEGKGKTIFYDDRIKEERLAQKEGKSTAANELLINSIDYFKKNYKDTLIKIDPKKTLNENLDLLTEAQLFEVNFILEFCHDPKDFDRMDIPRLIVSIPDHDILKRIIVKLKKRIPAFKQRVELERLETQESEIEIRKKKLRKEIIKAQADFKEKTIEPVKEKFDIEKIPITCTYPGCNKVCNSPAGLASHLRSHKNKEEQPLIPKSMKSNPNSKTIPGSKGTIQIG